MSAETITAAFEAVRLYAETHPRPIQVTIEQAQPMIGRSHTTIRKMIRAGIIKLNACGMIPISEIDRAISPRSAS